MTEFAAEHDDYLSEPNDEGDILPRAGTLNDPLWKPYKNDKVPTLTLLPFLHLFQLTPYFA